MKKRFIVKSKLMQNERLFYCMSEVILYLKQIFDIEYMGQTKFTKNAQDEFYAMQVFDVSSTNGISFKTPQLTVTPNSFRRWTGKDIPEIKTKKDFSKIGKKIASGLKPLKVLEKQTEQTF